MAGTIVADQLEAASTSTLVIKNGVANTPPTIQDSAGTQIGTFCRAWVNFNGTGTVAIRASFNVSSITDNGTGDYTVNITNALPDANYSITGTTSMIFGVNYNGALAINTNNTTAAEVAPTTTAFRVATRNSSGTQADIAYINVSVFR
jgi:hypothetical protein